MSDLPADIDDAGIFALVILATIAVGAALVYLDVPLWLIIPAFVAIAVTGELAARQLAALKKRQMYGGDET